MADVAQLSIPLPGSLDTRIYVRLATQAKAVVLSLATAAPDEPPPPMGSLVYALPDRERQALSTTLFAHEPTLDFTTRLARLLARRARRPVYVTNSSLGAAVGGPDEELEAFRGVVVALERLRADRESSGPGSPNQRADCGHGDTGMDAA